MQGLSTIAHLLACPVCRGGLWLSPATPTPPGCGRHLSWGLPGPPADTLTCAGGGNIFPVVHGIPQLALFSDGSEDPPEAAGGSTGAYERRYQGLERARSYNLKTKRE